MISLKKSIPLWVVLSCTPVWAGGEPAIIETGISVEELVAAAKKVPDLEKRVRVMEVEQFDVITPLGRVLDVLIEQKQTINELEKRIEALEKRVNNLPRVTLPDDTHSWTLTPN